MVTVNATYTDLAGNVGSSGSDTIAIDRLGPTASFSFTNSVLTSVNDSTVLTVEFSEPVLGFSIDDVETASGINKSDFLNVDATTYTLTLTADPDLSFNFVGGVSDDELYRLGRQRRGPRELFNLSVDTLVPSCHG